MDFPVTVNIDLPDDLAAKTLDARILEMESAPPARRPAPPRIVGVGTAASATSFSQQDVLDAFDITDPKIRSVFLNSAIERRHLTLPPPGEDGTRASEPQGDLLDKHRRLAIEMGADALRACLKRAGADLSDIGHLCCVTSTGFLTPGLSALLIRELGIDRHCSRSDIVGMGCNAGLNALNVVAGWATAHPGQLAVVLCTEACSAAYAMDSTMRTAVVNSLFGDGAAAVALVADGGDAVVAPAVPAGAVPGGAVANGAAPGPRILKFASCIIPEAIEAMRYDWDRDQGRFSFFLDPQIPYVVGAHAEIVVDRLLAGTGLRRGDIRHWLVHSGGKKVIDAVVVNLGLSRYDVRHTTGVLRDYGNVSSGSFLFSYERLLEEKVTAPGEYGVLMTMGPGSTIETALVQW
ncbi:3,5-dihydroxyphenylacetyl-CoA synthase DpgA [Actinomadura viridis]|uniref:Alkylresorcinol/alkylpyrone synthase/polyketide synthase Type III n=1 Tax=Actinomadura viridis TaxID=58110 RepID=A0A931GV89_9ACTN|nr:3,5-dihydroxyphenylacetyl-CoA synthase DpgA [Actinomadura viridis]MBG6094009.1 alkylresorcinol/alkylpyrone synthase/polyketide synthase Type III [Actinomadura viridis]